jgi:hypothetical protein
MSLKPGYFLCNNVNSETLNVFIQERPDISAPKRRISFVSPQSFEGELIYDDDGYETTEMELKCFYDGRSHGDSHQNISEARNAIYTFFNQGRGEWIPFVPYFDEGHVYLVILTELEFENKYFYDGSISFTAKLKCQPYKYLRNIRDLTVTNGETISNPTQYIAKPTISFSNIYGDIDITIGDTKMGFRSLNNETVVVDCENYATFTKNRNNIRNLNDRTMGKEFYELNPGNNTVKISTPNGSDVTTTLTIKPNWRVLV